MKTFLVVALIGQTNAGKSSLLNRFAHKNIAIVAREEGTTRDNVVAKIDFPEPAGYSPDRHNFSSGRTSSRHRNSSALNYYDPSGSYMPSDRRSFSDASHPTPFLLIDTAGLKDPTDDFEASIQDQITDAIESADVILVTLDSTKYFDHKDAKIAKNALKSKKPVFLVLNKSDLKESLPLEEFRALGIAPENTFYVSATTGQGIAELKQAIRRGLGKRGSAASSTPAMDFSDKNSVFEGKIHVEPETAPGDGCGVPVPSAVPARDRGEEEAVEPRNLKVALIGRPNVGKSSLFNTLTKKQQALVSSKQGTTRDINRVELRYKGRSLEILDTAGLRKPGRREVGIEKFSAIRTLAAIEEADICALLIDSTEPHSKLDQSLAGQIVDAGKSIIIVVTKSDLLENAEPTNYFGEENIKNRTAADFLLDSLERDFDFLPYAPVIFTSSETGKNATKLFDLALDVDEARHHEIATKDLNKILNSALEEHPAAGLKNTHPKPKYIVQTDVCPPWFVVHGHELQLLHWSYKRFLERKIREFYPYLGTPICFSFRSDNSERKVRKDAYDQKHGKFSQ